MQQNLRQAPFSGEYAGNNTEGRPLRRPMAAISPRRGAASRQRLRILRRFETPHICNLRNGTAQRPSPTGWICGAFFLFPSALISTLATTQSALRLTAPLKGAALRGEDLGLAKLGAASRQRFRTRAITSLCPFPTAAQKQLPCLNTWELFLPGSYGAFFLGAEVCVLR